MIVGYGGDRRPPGHLLDDHVLAKGDPREVGVEQPIERLAELHELLGQAAGVVTDVTEEGSQVLGRLYGLPALERVEYRQHRMHRSNEPFGVAVVEVDGLALVLSTLEHGLLDLLQVVTEPVGHALVVVDHGVEQRPRRGHGPELRDRDARRGARAHLREGPRSTG